MGKSKFKESYQFLGEYFILMIGKPSELLYKPANMQFFKDYCDYFELKITKRKEEFKIRVYDGDGKELHRSEHAEEREMIQSLKKYLKETKKIDKIKKIFKP